VAATAVAAVVAATVAAADQVADGTNPADFSHRFR
jgi:hypothetical protein